ncbi:MAG: hypothetical protein G01um101472_576 [Parcubacteria group bacterium Gr01-1014_72]|nr:MAG: hypothetical protein G01um101472_576 [Parcubacteria group bacterium Gr01-1014_72]
MTTNKVVTNDQIRVKPTAEQTEIYTRRESELRQRFLKGVLETSAVLDGLQTLLEMTRGCINCNGQPGIPDWADRENPIILHIPCGMVDPSHLSTETVLGEGEDCLDGEEYIARAQKIEGAMNACAFDFYSRPENWKYLPKDVDVIIFSNTIFRRSDGGRYVRYLVRDGAWWRRGFSWLSDRFNRHDRVARARK